MSNSFSMMLSFIFLSISIILSGELINYQQDNAKFMSEVTSIAIRIQEHKGVDSSLYEDIYTHYHFKEANIEYYNDFNYYSIEAIKDHKSLTSLFNVFNKEMKYTLNVYI